MRGGGNNINLRLAYKQMAVCYYRQNKYLQAKNYLEKSKDLMTDKLDKDSLIVLWSYLVSYKLEHCEIREYLRQAKQILCDFSSNDLTLITLYSVIGRLYQQLNYLNKAYKQYQKAYFISEKYGEYTQNMLDTILNFANFNIAKRQYANSQFFLLKALKLTEAVHGNYHPKMAETLNQLGIVNYFLGQTHKAILYIENALAIKERHGADTSFTLLMLLELAFAYSAMGQNKKSLHYFELANQYNLSEDLCNIVQLYEPSMLFINVDVAQFNQPEKLDNFFLKIIKLKNIDDDVYGYRNGISIFKIENKSCEMDVQSPCQSKVSIGVPSAFFGYKKDSVQALEENNSNEL